MRLIPLQRHRALPRVCAIVDNEDYAQIGHHLWYQHSAGYAARRAFPEGRIVYLHRELFGLAHGDTLQVDHINRQRLDNRRENLRLVTPAQNSQNHRRFNGSSHHRGVYWSTASQKWVAQGKLNGRPEYLGRFDSEREAAEAAAAWRREHMPFSEEAIA